MSTQRRVELADSDFTDTDSGDEEIMTTVSMETNTLISLPIGLNSVKCKDTMNSLNISENITTTENNEKSSVTELSFPAQCDVYFVIS